VGQASIADDAGPQSKIDENCLGRLPSGRVTVLRRVRTLAGYDGKKKGANLDRAAATLVQNLEEYLKENYWDLAERRRQAAARGVDLPPPLEVSTPSPPAELPDPIFATYLEALESYQRGDFIRAAGPSHLRRDLRHGPCCSRRTDRRGVEGAACFQMWPAAAGGT
jgi:hypothetical protein